MGGGEKFKYIINILYTLREKYYMKCGGAHTEANIHFMMFAYICELDEQRIEVCNPASFTHKQQDSPAHRSCKQKSILCIVQENLYSR